MSGVANLRQRHFRFRTDTLTVDSTSAVWGAAEDVNYYPGTGTNFRLRFVVDNTGTAGPGNGLSIRYSLNAAAYVLVTTASSVLRAADAGTDLDDTSLFTQQLSSGAGTFVQGRYDESGAMSAKIPSSGNYTEHEFGLVVVTTSVAPGDTIDVRIFDGSTAFPTYDVTPRITIPAASSNFLMGQVIL